MEMALSLPEIQRHIGLFLSTEDLKNCSILSKAWAGSLTPWLWRSATIQSTDSPSFLEILKHVDHVRSLTFDQVTLSRDQYALFRSLTAMTLKLTSTSPANMNDIIALVQCNRPTLRLCYVEDCQGVPSEVLQNILDCPSLERLSLTKIVLQERDLAQELLQACTRLTRLTRLNITMLNSSDWSMLNTPTQAFHRLTSLRFATLGHPDQLGLLKACPTLRILAIRLLNTITVKEFTDILLPSCPNLRMLFFNRENNEEIQEADQLIQCLPPMECVQVRSTDHWIYLGPPKAYSRHYATLQIIMLDPYVFCSSSDTQTILSSCPNLRYISGGMLDAKDIHPQTPWACLGLEYFGIRLLKNIVEPSLWSLIWNQLSRLTRLRYLKINRSNRSALPSSPIAFGLDDGLELLAPLRRLVHLEISGLPLDWRKEEVEWVIQSWPSLCSIHGKIHRLEEIENELWMRIYSAGISCKKYDMGFWDDFDII